LLLAYLHFPLVKLSDGYLIVKVLDYSVLPCFELQWGNSSGALFQTKVMV